MVVVQTSREDEVIQLLSFPFPRPRISLPEYFKLVLSLKKMHWTLLKSVEYMDSNTHVSFECKKED